MRTPAGVDLGHFSGQSMAGQPEAVGAEGVGLKNLGAGLQVLLVNGEDQAGIGEVQLVVAAVDEDAAGVEHGAHGAVGEHGAAGEDVGKLRHSLVMLRHAGRARQQAGLLCYTSVVINWGCAGPAGSRAAVDRQPALFLAAALAAGITRGCSAFSSR